MTPSVEKGKAIICQNAINVATSLLAQRGLTFRVVKNQKAAKANFQRQEKFVLEEDDLEGASACLMQNYLFFKNPKYANDARISRIYSKMLCKLGDHYFYEGFGKSDRALNCYQLAAGLDILNEEALWEVISVCLQGQPFRPKVALPYAVVIAHLNPNRNEVDYVLRLVNYPAAETAGC